MTACWWRVVQRAHLAVVGFVFDQGVQFARVLPGALFTILQVGAEPGEALVTVVGLLGCGALQMSYPTPALPPHPLLGQNNSWLDWAMKANSRLNKQALSLVFTRQINAPAPLSLAPFQLVERGRAPHWGNYHGSNTSTSLCHLGARKEYHESLLWAMLPGPQWLWTWGVWSPLSVFSRSLICYSWHLWKAVTSWREIEKECPPTSGISGCFVLGRTRSCCIDQAGLQLAVFLSQPGWCWDDRHLPPPLTQSLSPSPSPLPFSFFLIFFKFYFSFFETEPQLA